MRFPLQWLSFTVVWDGYPLTRRARDHTQTHAHFIPKHSISMHHRNSNFAKWNNEFCLHCVNVPCECVCVLTTPSVSTMKVNYLSTIQIKFLFLCLCSLDCFCFFLCFCFMWHLYVFPSDVLKIVVSISRSLPTVLYRSVSLFYLSRFGLSRRFSFVIEIFHLNISRWLSS